MYSGIDAFAVNYCLYSSVRRFEIIKNTAISDHTPQVSDLLDTCFDVIITTW